MSLENPSVFWESIADHFTWKKRWDEVVRWNFDEPKIEWFIGGKLNITENILDRHLVDKGDKTAIIWEPNDPKEKVRKIKNLNHGLEIFSISLKIRGCLTRNLS